jgi:predicted nucleotidyltransferase
MTPEQRIARAHHAERAWDEFVAPIVNTMRETYSARLTEIATTELSRDKRADKITSLANALRILGEIEGGMREAMRDGELAHADKLRAEKIEQLSAPKRRLLQIGTGY